MQNTEKQHSKIKTKRTAGNDLVTQILPNPAFFCGFSHFWQTENKYKWLIYNHLHPIAPFLFFIALNRFGLYSRACGQSRKSVEMSGYLTGKYVEYASRLEPV